MLIRKKQVLSFLLFLFTFISLTSARISVQAADSSETKNILILNSYHSGFEWTDQLTESITSTLKNSNTKTSISIEYMDWKRYPTVSNLDNIYSNLKLKYSSKKLDLIICTDDAALSFALKHRSEFLSNAPIVFAGVNQNGMLNIAQAYTNYTGVVELTDAIGTVRLAQKLNDKIKNVYIIFDATESGISTGEISEKEIKEANSNLNVIPLTNMSQSEILDKVKTLNEDSIVILTVFTADKNGVSVDPSRFCGELSKNSIVPIYPLYSFMMGSGALGGSMVSGSIDGTRAGELALRILRGEAADSIPVLNEKSTDTAVDYKVLTKLNISESKLPKGVKVVNKPFSFFDTYKTGIIISSIVFGLMLTLLSILLFYIKKIKGMKRELESNHDELTGLYEELTATDEEIRAQYDELAVTQNILSNSEERYRLVLQATNDAIWDVELNTGLIFLSDRWYEIFGYNKSECENNLNFWKKLVHPDDLRKISRELQYHLQDTNSNFEIEFRLMASNAEYRWLHARGKVVCNSKETPNRMTGSLRDITEIKEYESELQYTAYHDSLTGLHNRLYLYEKIGSYLSGARRKNSSDAMLFIDTDNFKFVNDTMGHSFGDKLLQAMGMRLLSLADIQCEIFRLGGDEFIFYIKNVSDKHKITEYAANILEAFKEPFNIDGNTISTSISIGISVFPEDGTDVDSLLKSADMAMYKVKEKGKNGYFFFNSIINDEIINRVNIEKNFKNALQNNEFVVYYQPQVNVSTKRTEAFEALVRWQSPQLGMVSPLKFIGIAEETGFIVPLGEWILRTSCEFIKKLNEKKGTEYKISVNISVIQLLRDNFTEMVEKALSDTGLSPSLLELEITESIIMESPDLIVDKLKLLRDKGISIALDDFGTGYSSLAYLRRIPITTLKIDKMFIDDISSAECSTALTNSIIDLGHKIGLTIVAEGVETTHQLEYLESNKCDMIQGYLFSKPLPPVEIEKIL